MTKARDLGKLVSQGQILADGTVQASEVTGLAAVATSGSYNDLTNKPTNLGGGVTNYNDLTDKPNLATVATTGSYVDLTNKPTIPSIAGLATTAEVALKADASSLATVATTGSYADLTNKPTIPSIAGLATTAEVALKVDASSLATVATTGSYTDLVNKPANLKIGSVDYPGDDLAADPAGGQTITLTGTGFEPGAQVLVDTTVASVVTVVNSTTITFTAPARAAGTYVLYVVNTDGSVALGLPGISYSGTPAWSTGAGTLGTQFETTAVNRALSATSNSTVTYSVVSGSLPPGSTLNSSTGVISGTAPGVDGSTTYNFIVRATDGENQDTDRAFSITVSPDSVTWTNPANNATITAEVGTVVNLALAATAASGNSVSYSANQLPAGLTVVGNAVTGTLATSGDLTTTLTATAASSLKTAARTVNWSIFVAADPNFNRTVLLLQGNGTNAAQNNTFLDSSANNFTITRNGNPTQGSFSPYGNLWSNFFNGTSSYLTTSTTQSFNPGVGNWTIEAWLYCTSASGNDTLIVGNAADFYCVWLGDTFYLGDGVTNTLAVANAKPLNQWFHFACVKNGSTYTAYINGIVIGTTTTTLKNITLSTWQIGLYNAISGYMNGYISNLRVVNGTALYTSSFTPSTTPLTAISGTSLLTCQSNRLRDNSVNNITLTAFGNTSVQRFSPFAPPTAYSPATIGGSAYFDGNGDYLTVAPSSAFNFGTGDYTIEGWVNSSSTTWTLYGTGGSGSIDQFVCDGGILYWGYADGSPSNYGVVNFFTNNDLNQWVHVAVSRSGTTQRCFKNGIVMGTITTSTSYGSSTVSPEIGRRNDNNYLTTGYISNLRVVKGTAVYTSAFTPPTAPLTAISGTSLLTHFTNAAIVDGAAQNNLETAGNAQISTSVLKFGTGSIYFDGAGDRLAIPSRPSLNLNGDFTIEMWVYMVSLPAFSILLDISANGSAGSGMTEIWVESNGSVTYYARGTTLFTTSDGSITTGTWNHIAVVKSGTSQVLYINGTSRASLISSVQPNTDLPYSIGDRPAGAVSANYPLNGYIDDLRITNGLARYTTNFTPPIEQLRSR